GCGWPALEQLAGQIRIALAIPADGRITARLPVLARECVACADRVAGEVVGCRGFVPGPTFVEAVGNAAGAVAAAIVVVAGDDVIGLVRVGRDRLFVLRLP